MAKTWTKTIGIGTYGAQLRLRVMLLSQNKSANTSQVRTIVDANTGNNSGVHNQGSGANVSVSGTVSKTINGKTFSIGRNAWGTFLDETFTVKHDADGSKALSISGRLWSTGTSAFGNGGTVKVTATLPRLILAPTAPTWGSTSYVSASRIEITWTNRATARGPYSNLEVQRHNGSKWQSLITLGATGSKVGDPGFPKNSEVRYRVRAKGPGGTSGWVQGGTLGTTPAAPSSVSARKSGQNIVVSWKDNAGPTNRARTFIVQDNPDGNGWAQVGTIGGSATSWTHNNPDASKTHQYRVQARITSGRTHESSWSAASSTVQLQAAPKQPSKLSATETDLYIKGETVRLSWRHNPVDTTAQTAAEIVWKTDDDSTTTVKVDGGSQFVDIEPEPSDGRGTLTWRVRTKGDHPDWSPWTGTSGPAQISTPPDLVIQEPTDGGTLDVSRAVLAWAYESHGDASQLEQSTWEAELETADGDVVEQTAGTTQEAVNLDTRLENGTEYTVRARARNGDGLWSGWDTASFVTDFPLPPKLEVVPEWDRAEAAVAVMVQETGEDEVSVEYRWAGEAHESVSERVVDGEVVRTNLAENPSFEGEIAQPGLTEGSSNNGRSSASDEWKLTGSQSVRIDPSEGSNSDSTWYALGGTEYADDVAEHYGFSIGDTFTIGATIHLEEEQTGDLYVHARRIRVNAHDTDGESFWGFAMSDPAPNEAGSYRVTLTFTVPDEASKGITVNLCNGSGNEPVWWDGLTIEKGATPGTYFDGDTPLITDQVRTDVERRDPDGDWLLIASGIGLGETIIDRTPQIGDVEYRAIARTTLPTERTGEVAVAEWVHDHDPVWVNGGASMGTVRRARGAEASDEYGVEQTSHQFAGRSRPTPFFGETTTREVSMTGRILHVPDRHEVSTRPEWVELLHEFGVVCYRDCRGRKVFGILELSFDTKQTVETVSVKVQETEWEEGVQRLSDLDLEAQLSEGGDDE